MKHEEAVAALDADDVREKVRRRAADRRGVLKRSTAEVRQALARMIIGKFDAEPVVVDGGRGYKLTGQTTSPGSCPTW